MAYGMILAKVQPWKYAIGRCYHDKDGSHDHSEHHQYTDGSYHRHDHHATYQFEDFVGHQFASFKTTESPLHTVETFWFKKVDNVFVTVGSSSGENRYREFGNNVLLHISFLKVVRCF